MPDKPSAGTKEGSPRHARQPSRRRTPNPSASGRSGPRRSTVALVGNSRSRCETHRIATAGSDPNGCRLQRVHAICVRPVRHARGRVPCGSSFRSREAGDSPRIWRRRSGLLLAYDRAWVLARGHRELAANEVRARPELVGRRAWSNTRRRRTGRSAFRQLSGAVRIRNQAALN